MPRRDIKGIFLGFFPFGIPKIRERKGEEISKTEILYDINYYAE
jgi:hypothetical protein